MSFAIGAIGSNVPRPGSVNPVRSWQTTLPALEDQEKKRRFSGQTNSQNADGSQPVRDLQFKIFEKEQEKARLQQTVLPAGQRNGMAGMQSANPFNLDMNSLNAELANMNNMLRTVNTLNSQSSGFVGNSNYEKNVLSPKLNLVV